MDTISYSNIQPTQKSSNGFLIFYIIFVSIVSIGALTLSILVLTNIELFKPDEPEQLETKQINTTLSSLTVPDQGPTSISTMSLINVNSTKGPNKTYTSSFGPFTIGQVYNNSSQITNSTLNYNADKFTTGSELLFSKSLKVNKNIQFTNNTLSAPVLNTESLSSINTVLDYYTNKNSKMFMPYSTGNSNNRIVTINIGFLRANKVLKYSVNYNSSPQFNYDSVIDNLQPAKIFIINDSNVNNTVPLTVIVNIEDSFNKYTENDIEINPLDLINGSVIDIIFFKNNPSSQTISGLTLSSSIPNISDISIYYTYCSFNNYTANNKKRQMSQNVNYVIYNIDSQTCFLTNLECNYRVNKIYIFSNTNVINLHVETYSNIFNLI